MSKQYKNIVVAIVSLVATVLSYWMPVLSFGVLLYVVYVSINEQRDDVPSFLQSIAAIMFPTSVAIYLFCVIADTIRLLLALTRK